VGICYIDGTAVVGGAYWYKEGPDGSKIYKVPTTSVEFCISCCGPTGPQGNRGGNGPPGSSNCEQTCQICLYQTSTSCS
jgi:hypothetical protein